MRLIDISYLNGSGEILADYPHLKKARVGDIFTKIRQNDDGSFTLRGQHPELYAINIEDGRQKVWSNPSKPYCQHAQTPEMDECAAWFGDPENGLLLFQPGPDKDIGITEYVNWKEVTKPPSVWIWVIIGILIWKLMK